MTTKRLSSEVCPPKSEIIYYYLSCFQLTGCKDRLVLKTNTFCVPMRHDATLMAYLHGVNIDFLLVWAYSDTTIYFCEEKEKKNEEIERGENRVIRAFSEVRRFTHFRVASTKFRV